MKSFFALLVAAVLAVPVQAQESVAPDVLIKSVTDAVIDIVRKDKDIQSGNSKKAMELIDAKVLPNFNFAHMTALAVARNWRQATPAQQKSLSDEFRALLVRTYSKALTDYKNQTIEFKPFKMNPADTDAKVRTQVMQPGNQPVPLDYYLEKVGQSWQVYDIEVSGVSLVTAYRSEFANEIRNGGIDGLIKTLQAKNHAGGETKAAAQK
jgi:phospholipid transport system substrate-binding protein